MDMSAKLGPLPVYAWGGLLGIGAVGFMYWQQLNAVTEPDTSTGDTVTPTVSSDAIDGGFSANPSTLATSEADPVLDTNLSWSLRAIASLVGTGIAPLTAQRAIQKYLNGDSLTSAEEDLVNRAVAAKGSPPESVELVSGTATTYSSYQRRTNGDIVGIASDGTEKVISPAQYIALGMPAFSSNSYGYKYYTAKSASETLTTIAAKYKTSPENLIVMNRITGGIRFYKGKKVKVPANG